MFLTYKLRTYAKLNFLKIELTIRIKMDLALNNLQRLNCHKRPNQPTNQHQSFACRHLNGYTYMIFKQIVCK